MAHCLFSQPPDVRPRGGTNLLTRVIIFILMKIFSVTVHTSGMNTSWLHPIPPSPRVLWSVPWLPEWEPRCEAEGPLTDQRKALLVLLH